ncbi:MAG: Rpn family recombination-promoting nuclease/putative transposase [Planctomycetes bacterium]|nr:Rpn family recombination-promoting nuclease/putative transposase [Planctomycetota bacterium]
MKERYINPFTDFGFKRLFGSEPNKDLLLDFLNELIKERGHIQDLTYLKAEQLGLSEFDRRAVFDLYCESDTGEKFIVEMQKAKQKYFKDRSVFYSTFPIREQARRGDEWDFQLNAVYTVGILDFVFDEDKDSPEYFHHHVQLMETKRKKVFFDKLTYIYLEMPKFTKTEEQLETHFDKWLYVIKNLPRLQERPRRIQERVFHRLFEAAEIARFDPAERAAYEESIKVYRDLKNVIDTGREEGREQGREEGREQGSLERAREIARRMKTAGEPVAKIVAYTGLTAEQIADLE